MAQQAGDGINEPVVVKKYANRRLYNTATSSYVTLDHLCKMVKDGVDFVVYDAKSGDDITRSVLTQIIFEEENKGQNLLPIGFLRQLIGFYDDGLRTVLPTYLDLSMQAFARNQEEMRAYVGNTFGDLFPIGQMQQWGAQNMAVFERALGMFAPPAGAKPEPDPNRTAATEPAPAEDEIGELRRQLDDMQRQLDSLAGRGGN
ncbi:MAG: polyhydroxyalkanoate synthesis repressor PhaR [Alphaproteobacteria bacterium]|jgi:polyhydroxyalkanoate synthesis repressor PhaR|nr:polyhydroxyalkanoate synthesis repressor PhaR [Alphaproteobacteria bacterium]MDP6517357.1 polyhydroxyalkanoate synthesis repressor PhaR [Alphaproteobacteria bacterium]